MKETALHQEKSEEYHHRILDLQQQLAYSQTQGVEAKKTLEAAEAQTRKWEEKYYRVNDQLMAAGDAPQRPQRDGKQIPTDAGTNARSAL